MYSDKEYSHLKKKHGAYSSWAVWNQTDPKDTSVIEKERDNLNSRYVFLGLNIASPLTVTWQNFHGGKHDRKLMKVCSNSDQLHGAYLTDIFKGIVTPKSSELAEISEEVIRENVLRFREEMRDIKVTENTVFIILGVEASLISKYFKRYFQEGFPNRTINHYHYSYYKLTDREWVDGLLEKIKLLQQ